MRPIICPMLLALLCAACGIKGPLYLPPPPKQPAAAPAPAPEASQPVPDGSKALDVPAPVQP